MVDPRPPRHVRIVHLTAPVFHALARGDLAAANSVSPVPLSPYFAGPEWSRVWQIRSEQVEQDPASAAWVTGVIWDEEQQVTHAALAGSCSTCSLRICHTLLHSGPAK